MTPPSAGALALAPSSRTPDTSNDAASAARDAILACLAKGRPLDSAHLKRIMTDAFGADDASGAWHWKDAYDIGEAATVLFLRTYGRAMRLRAQSCVRFGCPPTSAQATSTLIDMFDRVARLLPTHTNRTKESANLQQFSTPIALGLVAATAAHMTAADLVLEPSAGTGLLAIFAELHGSRLALNEIAPSRLALLAGLYPHAPLSAHDGKHLDDLLAPALVPTVVLMNPPFSADLNLVRADAHATHKHLRAALARLAPGGRLVTLTGASFAPETPAWRAAFIDLQRTATLVFTQSLAGDLYKRQGTTFPTRLTVLDKTPAADPTAFPAVLPMAATAQDLLVSVETLVPQRTPPAAALPLAPATVPPSATRPKKPFAPRARRDAEPTTEPSGVPLAYSTVAWVARDGVLTETLYEPYEPQSIRIPGAHPHPTKLVQSAAMASVAPPNPTYRPLLQPHLVRDGLLSDAQLETIIAAGDAHATMLAGHWRVDHASTSSSPRLPTIKPPKPSAGDSSSATAPAPARAARPPASSSTTGTRAAARRCGSPSPTS